jgi:integrase
LYDTAVRVNEILAVDVRDVDFPNRRRPGGVQGWDERVGALRLRIGAPAAPGHPGPQGRPSVRLLAAPSPARAPAAADLDLASGYARLSYRQAKDLFARNSGGRTLHQLRHSALTHLAEVGESAVTLMAKSRHRALQTLQRYAARARRRWRR